MNHLLLPTLAALFAGLLLCASGSAADEGPFAELLASYHVTRSALVHDDLDAAFDAARPLEERAREALDLPGAQNEEWAVLVAEISAAAAELRSADDLKAAREAFFDVSKPLSRYRKLVGDDSTVVAYCPMEKKAWLQPAGDIQNPYGGQAMPRCGQTIPD